jgi:hypothetical protein
MTTVTSIQYAGMLANFIVHELHNFPQQIDNTWFQHDGATAHTAWISTAAIRRLFGNRVISRNGEGAWPPGSPDLTACDFFLWGHFKCDVYRTPPTATEEHKARIREEIARIPVAMLRRVMHNVAHRLQECLRREESYLQEITSRYEIQQWHTLYYSLASVHISNVCALFY